MQEDLHGVSELDGSLTVERSAIDMLVVAQSEKEGLAGYKILTANDREVTIDMFPTATVTGRLVDTSNDPIANASLSYDIQMLHPDRSAASWIKNETTTDGDGRFTLTGMCLGVEYHVGMITRRLPNGKIGTTRPWFEITPKKSRNDLGDVKQSPRYPLEYESPGAEKSAIYFRSKDPIIKRFTAAISDARKFDRNLFIVAGSPKRQPAIDFFEATNNLAVTRSLIDYQMLSIDVSPDADPLNLPYLKRILKTELDPEDTALVVIDPDQNILGYTTVKRLSAQGPSLNDAIISFAASTRRAFPSRHTD